MRKKMVRVDSLWCMILATTHIIRIWWDDQQPVVSIKIKPRKFTLCLYALQHYKVAKYKHTQTECAWCEYTSIVYAAQRKTSRKLQAPPTFIELWATQIFARWISSSLCINFYLSHCLVCSVPHPTRPYMPLYHLVTLFRCTRRDLREQVSTQLEDLIQFYSFIVCSTFLPRLSMSCTLSCITLGMKNGGRERENCMKNVKIICICFLSLSVNML